MTATHRRVLVNGAGPAGAVTAFWLAKAGFEVMVTERSTSRPYGQGIDLTGRAVDIVKRMGLEQTIRAHTTGEEGLTLVDNQGMNVAPPLGIAPIEGGTASVTQEIEITRRDMTRIFVSFEQETMKHPLTCALLHRSMLQKHNQMSPSDMDVQSTRFNNKTTRSQQYYPILAKQKSSLLSSAQMV